MLERHGKAMQIRLPQNVKNIIESLEKAGYEAYAVGGCVRDSLLGREPQDWDITTNAEPAQMKELFRRTVDTGIRHGTVTVLLGKEGYEVTTYRIDGKYEDGRHPRQVEFTARLEEDLCRRDFTVNAMAYHPGRGLVDLYGGMKDLDGKIIRCVGDARERFREDALRMMRALRFSAQLSFSIEKETLAAIGELSQNLAKISAERIQAELVKLLCSPNPDYARGLYETGLSAVFLPEFDACMRTPQHNPHHCYSVGEHILHSMKYVSAQKDLRLAMFFHDIGKPQTKQTDEDGIDHFHGHAELGEKMAYAVMRRLKFDTDTTVRVSRLVRGHDKKIESDARGMRRAVAALGADLFPALLEVKEADLRAQSNYRREEKERQLALLKELYEENVRRADCVCLKDLAVSGRDLIDAGIPPGPRLGETLAHLLDLVLEEPACNTREFLLAQIKNTD